MSTFLPTLARTNPYEAPASLALESLWDASSDRSAAPAVSRVEMNSWSSFHDILHSYECVGIRFRSEEGAIAQVKADWMAYLQADRDECAEELIAVETALTAHGQRVSLYGIHEGALAVGERSLVQDLISKNATEHWFGTTDALLAQPGCGATLIPDDFYRGSFVRFGIAALRSVETASQMGWAANSLLLCATGFGTMAQPSGSFDFTRGYSRSMPANVEIILLQELCVPPNEMHRQELFIAGFLFGLDSDRCVSVLLPELRLELVRYFMSEGRRDDAAFGLGFDCAAVRNSAPHAFHEWVPAVEKIIDLFGLAGVGLAAAMYMASAVASASKDSP